MDPVKDVGIVHLASNNRHIAEPIALADGAYYAFDASRLWTFFIAIALVVYGSFRSMRVEQDSKADGCSCGGTGKAEKPTTTSSSTTPVSRSNSQQPLYGAAAGGDCSDCESGDQALRDDSGMQTIDACQAMFLPFGASASLLIMFYFFDSLQILFTLCTGLLATIAFAFLLMPVCQCVMRPLAPRFASNKITVACFGRYTPAQILATVLSVSFVGVWVATGHWLLMDVLGMGLCVAFIAFIRLPSLKVSTMLLVGLLLYDLFWVFFSSYLFSTNVMMKVATRASENPVSALVRKLNLHPSDSGASGISPKLSLPGKLVFPSMQKAGNFSMLGLGDIVMPGLLLCFVLRYDMSRKNHVQAADAGVPPPSSVYQRIKYFHCSLIGYFLGLLTATVTSEIFNNAQPALLYLVPFTLLPLLLMAYLRGDLKRMWSEPFQSTPLPKYLNV